MSPDGSGPTGVLVLIIGDDGRAERLADQLAVDGYELALARTVQHARRLARDRPPAAVIVGELGGPRTSLALVSEIRRDADDRSPWSSAVPVMLLGRWAADVDVLRAFEAGADDFMADPPVYLVLRARLGALLRRARPASPRCVRVGPLELDTVRRSVAMRGQPLELSRLEYGLLAALASDPQRAFTREELLRRVWGFRCPARTRTVDSHASRLRHKLGGDSRRWIVNVWGVGYRLIP